MKSKCQIQQEFKKKKKNTWRKCTIHLHKLAAGKRSLSVWSQLCIVVCIVVLWGVVLLCEVNSWSVVCCGVIFYGNCSLSQQVSGNVGIWISLGFMSCIFCISLVFLKCFKMGWSAQVIPLDCFSLGTNGGDLSKYLKRGSQFIRWGFYHCQQPREKSHNRQGGYHQTT